MHANDSGSFLPGAACGGDDGPLLGNGGLCRRSGAKTGPFHSSACAGKKACLEGGGSGRFVVVNEMAGNIGPVPVFSVFEEDGLAPVAARRHMMRAAGGNDPGKSSHDPTISP